MLLGVVLTMIAGARELLTPGAWEKQGLQYKLAGPAKPEQPMGGIKENRDSRCEHLAALQKALWAYAATHGGKFPAESDAAIKATLWEMPGGGGMHYLYVSGRRPRTGRRGRTAGVRAGNLRPDDRWC